MLPGDLSGGNVAKGGNDVDPGDPLDPVGPLLCPGPVARIGGGRQERPKRIAGAGRTITVGPKASGDVMGDCFGVLEGGGSLFPLSSRLAPENPVSLACD